METVKGSTTSEGTVGATGNEAGGETDLRDIEGCYIERRNIEGHDGKGRDIERHDGEGRDIEARDGEGLDGGSRKDKVWKRGGRIRGRQSATTHRETRVRQRKRDDRARAGSCCGRIRFRT